jgi:AcrR family transcriptional regulator
MNSQGQNAERQLDTQEKLLDAAEALFAEEGLSRASLRAITSQAGANIAAVNYHFGSKDGLVRAVFDRRIGPVNRERLRRLEFAEQASGATLQLEPILDAFFRPVFEQCYDSPERAQIVQRLCGRIFAEPGESRERILEEHFKVVGQRFLAALCRAMPNVPVPTMVWRLHFAIGAVLQIALNGSRIAEQSRGLCDAVDVDALTAQLVAFTAAGFRAPWPDTPGGASPIPWLTTT